MASDPANTGVGTAALLLGGPIEQRELATLCFMV